MKSNPLHKFIIKTIEEKQMSFKDLLTYLRTDEKAWENLVTHPECYLLIYQLDMIAEFLELPFNRLLKEYKKVIAKNLANDCFQPHFENE